MPADGALLELIEVSKSFGSAKVLAGINLTVGRGEFLTLLGPSGCGKTTTLRIIAGFERPDSGKVLLEGRDVAGLPPYKRNVHTVFQHYALFPHYTVFENVAFGLRIRKLPEPEIQARVAVALGLVKLASFAQRIALARAIVGRPALLLLDEPLGALDLKLRREMQLELKAIQRRLGIAFVYVTHDQDEAMAMSDRIIVFNHGRIEQVGTPAQVYHRPRTSFVADFMGSANILDARLVRSFPGCARVRVEDELEFDLPCDEAPRFREGEPLCVAVRPERIHVRYDEELPLRGDCVSLPAVLADTVNLGDETQMFLSLFKKSAKTVVAASMDARHQTERQDGTPVWVDIRWKDILLLEPPQVG